MKFAFALVLMFCTGAYAAESAGVAGMVIADDIVKNTTTGLPSPKNIVAMYFANDPEEKGVALAYIAFKKTGTHVASIELTDNNGKHIDRCTFDPLVVTKAPHIQTLTCQWEGSQPDGGINFTVFNKFAGTQEKIGAVFLPARHFQ
jgi:hypothetical protein